MHRDGFDDFKSRTGVEKWEKTILEDNQKLIFLRIGMLMIAIGITELEL
jgi:hypothetical protein